MSWLVTESHLMKSLWRPLKKKSSRTNSFVDYFVVFFFFFIYRRRTRCPHAVLTTILSYCPMRWVICYFTFDSLPVCCVCANVCWRHQFILNFLLLFSLKALERLFIVLFSLILISFEQYLNGIRIGSEWHRQRFVVIITSFWPSTSERRERRIHTESLWWCELYVRPHIPEEKGVRIHTLPRQWNVMSYAAYTEETGVSFTREWDGERGRRRDMLFAQKNNIELVVNVVWFGLDVFCGRLFLSV